MISEVSDFPLHPFPRVQALSFMKLIQRLGAKWAQCRITDFTDQTDRRIRWFPDQPSEQRR